MKKTLIPVLALSASLLVGCGSDDTPSGAASETGSAPGVPTTEQATTDPASGTASQTESEPGETATSEPVDPAGSLPDDLLPMDDPASSLDGEAVTFADGSVVTVTGDEVVIENGSDGTSVVLPDQLEGGVWQYPVEFAQAGTGYLVEQSGGEASVLSVVFPRDGDAVVASVPDDVPFGYEGNEVDGTLTETWTTGEGAALYTRVRVGAGESLSENEYRLYVWEAIVEPDADGGGVALQPTDLGIVCFDDEAGTYEACNP